MDKSYEILHYCMEQDRDMTAMEIVTALFPGKPQDYVNSTINDLVKKQKLVRVDTQPYTVHIPKAGETKKHEKGSRKNNKMIDKATFDIPRPCPNEVDKYLQRWENSENYRLQESALDKLFFGFCPKNQQIEDILIKVAALNDFYSTNIFSVYSVAKHILTLNIDKRLISGDLSLVNDIAAVQIANSQKFFYSFATKYCSHHQPKHFAIYDNYVHQILLYFLQKDKFAEFFEDDMKNYIKFNNILNKFRNFYSLQDYDLKMIDKYLWQLGKLAFPKTYK